MNLSLRQARFLAGGILAATMLLVGTSARAETLADLLDGGSIQVGDKFFDNFQYAPSGDMPDASEVEVIPIQDGLTIGLRFQGDFRDLTEEGNSEALLTYNVSVTDPLFSIVGANLAAQLNGEGGFFGVIETFLPDHPELGLQISALGESGLFSDSIDFDTPLTFLRVQKNITAAARFDTVNADYIDQTFIQIPEPSGMLLLLVGSLGAIWFVKRQRPRQAQSLA